MKEQQKRIFPSEFRNSAFSYTLGMDGVEQFVATPELHSDSAIESDPLPPGQVWALSPGGVDSTAGLFRVEVTTGSGSGVKILNSPVPPQFRESVKIAEQNLYTQSRRLVGDRDPKEHEFSLQMRAIDNDKSGAGLGLPVLLALSGVLLGKSTKGGLVIVGPLNIGGSTELLPNAVELAEMAIDKAAGTLLMPISARKQLFSLPDDAATKVNIVFYSDAADALLKALHEVLLVQLEYVETGVRQLGAGPQKAE